METKKTTKLAMERETSELMQQELEERIALQDELLETDIFQWYLMYISVKNIWLFSLK